MSMPPGKDIKGSHEKATMCCIGCCDYTKLSKLVVMNDLVISYGMLLAARHAEGKEAYCTAAVRSGAAGGAVRLCEFA